MFKSFLRNIFMLAYGSICLSASDGLTDAEGYRKHSSLQRKWAMESLEVFPFHENDQVLDLGCGDDSITAEIAAKVPSGKVIGLDISEEMLLVARTHHLFSKLDMDAPLSDGSIQLHDLKLEAIISKPLHQ
jgi:2-polyprenyl-3-methyl-5-hydroxy-6-metoxy-1,4-benzoquinol methylase